MKIEIIRNRSAFRADDLRKLIRRACKAVGARGDKLFTINDGRYPTWTGGRAVVGSRAHEARGVTLSIGRECPVEDIARVICHELMHTVGARHRDMTPEQRACSQAVPWAEGFELRKKPEPEQPTPESPAERGSRLRAEREAHARAMLAKATTRRRRAVSIERKWAAKVKRYERNGR